MHNEMLQVEGKKMSKSLGNFFSVRELIEKYENEFQIENFGPAIRLRFLQTHYRSPIDFSHYSLEQAATKLHTWSHMLDSCDAQESTSDEADQLISGTKFITAIADDLNTPDAISYIDQLVKELKAPMPNHTYGTEYLDNIGNKGKLLRCAVGFLGFDIDEIRRNRPDVRAKNRKAAVTSDNGSIQSLIEKLLVERDKARSGRDFNRADQIRDIFSDAGVVVTDTPEGADWQLAPNFDPSKLEALK
jgi:cysteinyl-tRNA synthetase